MDPAEAEAAEAREREAQAKRAKDEEAAAGGLDLDLEGLTTGLGGAGAAPVEDNSPVFLMDITLSALPFRLPRNRGRLVELCLGAR